MAVLMSQAIQNLPGFRDFFPEQCTVRNYVFQRWRDVAFRYGFSEYEGPVLEPTELFTRKSGDEIVKQLFHFTDGGNRPVSLRPEVTPSLARMATARQRDYKKPLKWFQIGPCFRYEAPQRGRGREFYQFNCDILGEPGLGADAELVAMAIDLMLDFGFEKGDFKVRLSDRRVWNEFASRVGIMEENLPAFLQVIDKLDRDKPEVIQTKLELMGTSLEAVREFMSDSTVVQRGVLGELMANLTARGMAEHIHIDLGIVRGLAYYTGVVFEIFDASGEFRAVAGGGRYDNLCGLIGGTEIPAAGFAMGDMVVAAFIETKGSAKSRLMDWQSQANRLDAYVVVADETRRNDAMGLVQALRADGLRVDYPLGTAKVGAQFQAAEYRKSRLSVVVGAEFPQIKIKDMTSREETVIDVADAVATVLDCLAKPERGPLLA